MCVFVCWQVEWNKAYAQTGNNTVKTQAGKSNKTQTQCTKERWHIHVHEHEQCEPVLLFPRSRLSHWGVSHLSCPFTADTAVKLSNKSMSQRSSAPPADQLTVWMTGWLLVSYPARASIRPLIGQKWAEFEYRNVSVSSFMVSCCTLQVNDML